MTARQVYEGVLVELNKVQAPSLLLEDFNYLFNKAINQYTNKRYNIYDVSQQTTDDLRVLKSSVVLRANNEDGPVSDVTSRDSMWGAIYEFSLPKDYLHLLNCICSFRVNKPFKCYNAGTYVQFGATRLTADLWSQIINNFYMRPTYKRPYYYIHNVNQDVRAFENSGSADFNTGTDPSFDMSTSTLRGQKEYAEGKYGRVPSERIYTPTDPGNVDIQQLVGLDINDLYSNEYIDDNNHYDEESQKYGIPRWAEFSELSGGSYLTGRGKLEDRFGNKVASFSFDPTYKKYSETSNTVWNGYINTIDISDADLYKNKYLHIFRSYEVSEVEFDGGCIKIPISGHFVSYETVKNNAVAGKAYDHGANKFKIKVWENNDWREKDRYAWVYEYDKGGATSYIIVMQTVTICKFDDEEMKELTSGLFRYFPLVLADESESISGEIKTHIDYDPNVWNSDDLVRSKFEFELRNSETKKYNLVERVGEVRYGNNSNVRLEIRYGKDNSLFTLDSVYIDYIKAPQWIRLTLEQLDLTEDTSQMMEFPDYVCQEIINELVHLVMENSADPRLQSHPVVTLSIAQPAQQLQTE